MFGGTATMAGRGNTQVQLREVYSNLLVCASNLHVCASNLASNLSIQCIFEPVISVIYVIVILYMLVVIYSNLHASELVI